MYPYGAVSPTYTAFPAKTYSVSWVGNDGTKKTLNPQYPDNATAEAQFLANKKDILSQVAIGTFPGGDGMMYLRGPDGSVLDQYQVTTIKAAPPPPPSQMQQMESKCFIATAAFGSPLEPEVETLRHFRHQVLDPNRVGHVMVKGYYTISPPIAQGVAKSDTMRKMVRGILAPLITTFGR
jgi:hypothetical protein